MTQSSLHPVSFSRHRHRSWRRFTSYAFARHRTDCPIVETEIFQAAATFPIAFRDSRTGPEPVALLSMMPGVESPFVSDAGMWLTTYVPSALRCPPFQVELPVADKSAGPERLQLMVDETSSLVSDDQDGEAFFDKSGQLAPELQKVRAFLQARTYAAKKTRQLCLLYKKLGLFSELTSVQGVQFPIGLLAIDAGALEQLSQSQMAVLTQKDAWRLIHAHQLSLLHGAWVLRAQQRLSQQSLASEQNRISDVAGFLDAMADANRRDANCLSLEELDAVD